MYDAYKAQLPATELGDRRCFQTGYFGHGDIVMSTWEGPVEHDPHWDDGISTRFGMAHGADVTLIASFAGYLTRAGRTEEEIKNVMHEAGKEILADDDEMLAYYHSLQSGRLNRVAKGLPAPIYDEPEQRLECLVGPRPTQPGLVEQTGGTALFTRNEEQSVRLVFAGLEPSEAPDGRPTVEIDRTADFCEDDVPVMAQLVCKMALGEYRRDIQYFLKNLYVER